MLEIPFTSDASQLFETDIAGRRLAFTAMFNDRSGVWTLGIADAVTNELIVDSLPIVLGQDLLEPYNLEIGTLIAIDHSNTVNDAGPDDLGTRLKVWWFSAEEVAEVAANG
jgi:hypothetical protein